MRFLIASAVCLFLVACSSPTVTRGSDDPEIDELALSTRLDRRDLDLALNEWITAFDESPFRVGLPEGDRTIAIIKIDNDTSEFIGSALQNLIESFETRLVNEQQFVVVSHDELVADAIMQERIRGMGDNVDPETVAALGREYGIHYFVHGRVGETTEKTSDQRRVQYYLFLKVTEVATNRRVFQYQIPITKMIES